HSSCEGELERVGEEIEDDLLPHVPIDIGRLGQRLALDQEADPRQIERGAEHRGEIRGEGPELRGHVASLDPAAFYAGEVEKGVDELAQPGAGAARGREQLAIIRSELRAI